MMFQGYEYTEVGVAWTQINIARSLPFRHLLSTTYQILTNYHYFTNFSFLMYRAGVVGFHPHDVRFFLANLASEWSGM